MPLRVLVVDDSAVMRLAIQRVIDLSCLPVKCFTAQHGSAALAVLKKEEIGLMLVDLNMPEMSGHDLLRHMHDDPLQPKIPFIVISADATETRMQEMLDLGALTYITKPFAPGFLRSEIVKALDLIQLSQTQPQLSQTVSQTELSQTNVG